MKILLIVLVLLCCTLVKGSRCYIVPVFVGQVSENDIYENILLPSKSENIKYLYRSQEEDFENYNMKVEAKALTARKKGKLSAFHPSLECVKGRARLQWN
ncbi:uncharacterized protein LOC128347157 isoform X5 [Hemicordylus capensis]|uniref:uncharacterized protein LOC128347157 isoform X5 n=1 Tax=Hemicordylus capensis TaxID=884348 RepID=UPI00230466FF|nr:uncharacterized protein LOC128347157 isoform X5 [Hemicordylus capensis]